MNTMNRILCSQCQHGGRKRRQRCRYEVMLPACHSVPTFLPVLLIDAHPLKDWAGGSGTMFVNDASGITGQTLIIFIKQEAKLSLGYWIANHTASQQTI